jgi:tetratricopeptide (TPR) repeat protein
MAEVRIMYSEIAQTIAAKTQVNLSAEEMTRLTSASQVNPESYDNYLKGKSHLYNFTQPELRLALQYFELALKIDPNNALAHVGVAMARGSLVQMDFELYDEKMLLVKASIEKALELDNTLAEAHYMLANNIGWGDYDWEGADAEYQQALKLSPNFPDAHAFYSHCLIVMGRSADEALPYIERALELDPLNPLFHGLYGKVLQYQKRFDDALAAAQTALDMVPGFPIAWNIRHEIYLAKGMHDELLAYQRQRYSPESVAVLERGFEEGGYDGAQRAIADFWAAQYGKPGTRLTAQGVAYRYLAVGDLDLVIEWLEKAYEKHDPNLPYIVWPLYDPLRSNPRFQELLRKMNLPVDEKE